MSSVDIATGEVSDTEPVVITHSALIDAAAFIRHVKIALPHAATDADDALHCVHLLIDADAGRFQAQATNRFSMVSSQADADAESSDSHPRDTWPGVNVDPGDLTLMCRMFKPGNDERLTIRLDLTESGGLILTDASGFFDGRSATIPTRAGEFPDVSRAIRERLAAQEAAGLGTFTNAMLGAERLKAFVASSAVDDLSPEFCVLPDTDNGKHRPILVLGHHYIGMLMPIDELPDAALFSSRLADWTERLS